MLPPPQPIIPILDTSSYLCNNVEVVDVHDGDTIHIDINDRQVQIRFAGIDAPELNKTEEKNKAIESRDYLESLILDKKVIVLFEKSESTLDGIKRGNFGRPIAYIFILADRNVKTFVNKNMIDNGKAKRYTKYHVDFPILFSDNFDLDDVEVKSSVNANHGKASVNIQRNISTTWAELRRIK